MIYNTICSATADRQQSCLETAKESDIMVIIGDPKSANTKKLYEISKKNCKKAIFVERKEDLPLKDVERCNKIGVAAGASTPERIIKEVISTMSEIITENTPIEENAEGTQMVSPLLINSCTARKASRKYSASCTQGTSSPTLPNDCAKAVSYTHLNQISRAETIGIHIV